MDRILQKLIRFYFLQKIAWAIILLSIIIPITIGINPIVTRGMVSSDGEIALQYNKYIVPFQNLENSIQVAILMDAKSGQVIYSYNPDVCLPMASTTKIMTAMLVLENTDLNDIVVVSDNAVRTIGTRVYLEPGESQTVENLLYAALLNSANDAAIALGEYLGKGSIDTFTAMMNQRALSLGAINTNFTNTTGLTEVNHFSTARDMALISREAMLNPKFREIVATRTYPWMGDKYQSSLVNLNRLLWTYPGITGIKTGYTSAAKNCLIASVQRDGHELISVILGSSSDIWKQSATLLDYGFECFVPTLLVNEGQIVTNVDISKQLRVPLLASRALQVSLPLGREDVRPQPQISVDSDIKLPLAAGTRIGQVTYEIEGQPLEPIPLIIAQDIPKEKSRLTMGVAGFSLIIVLLILRRILIHFRRLNYRRNRRNKRVQVIYRGQNPTFLAKKR